MNQTPIKVAFVCIHNSCRSQIAEALGNYFGDGILNCYSAGTEPKASINADAVRLLKCLYDIDIEQSQYPKLLELIPNVDMVVTMGCDVSCPSVPCKYMEDWGLDDPTGKDDDYFVLVIQTIERKIKELIEKTKEVYKNEKNGNL